MISAPLYIVLTIFGFEKPYHIGRLSIVYDQAGKARIIAVVNFWVQLILKPLHESIFRFLKEVPQDGTFDQFGPLDRIRSSPLEGHKFHCFDLSSATDRLPMDLQVDVLNAIGINGST